MSLKLKIYFSENRALLLVRDTYEGRNTHTWLALAPGAVIIVFSTCPPSAMSLLQERLDLLKTHIQVGHQRKTMHSLICRSSILLSPVDRLGPEQEHSLSCRPDHRQRSPRPLR